VIFNQLLDKHYELLSFNQQLDKVRDDMIKSLKIKGSRSLRGRMDSKVLTQRKDDWLTTAVPKALKEAVEAFATQNDMSKGAVVRLALVSFFTPQALKFEDKQSKKEDIA
jgi:hypothetical protein